VRPIGGSPPGPDGTSVPDGCWPPDVSPGIRPSHLPREVGRTGFRPGRSAAQGPHRFLVGAIRIGDSTVVGRARGQVPVANLKRVCQVFGPGSLACPARPWSAAQPFLRGWLREAQEGRGREADFTACESSSGEAPQNPGEHRPGWTSVRAGTDLRGEQRPGAAGYRGLLVLRAEECDARNSKRVTASKGVRIRGGGKL
jgi:hypothetical protein